MPETKTAKTVPELRAALEDAVRAMTETWNALQASAAYDVSVSRWPDEPWRQGARYRVTIERTWTPT